MSARVHTILFAVGLGFICSVLLVAVNSISGPYREANEKSEEIRNILDSLAIQVSPDADAQALLDIFDRNIRRVDSGDFIVYEYTPDADSKGRTGAVAIPFTGSGLWGPVEGVLALESDWQTVRGIRFYKHEETPGLGGEISSEWFQNQFVGKKIISDEKAPGFTIVKPGSTVDGANGVDGITGATMTSDRIADILNDLAVKIVEEIKLHVE